MKGNKITKVAKHLSSAIPSVRISHYKAMHEKPSSEYLNQNFGTHKRTRKQKLLLQLAILGFIIWGIILFLNKVIENHNKSAYLGPSIQSEFMVLSDLHVLEGDSVIHLPLKKNTIENARELKLRLQNLRMHNILRASSFSQTLHPNYSARAEYKTQISSANNIGTSNSQRMLIQKWEKDFLNLENE